MKHLKDEIKNITLYETPETDEALNLLKKHTDGYHTAIWICLTLGLIFSIPCLFGGFAVLIIAAPLYLTVLILVIICSVDSGPYKQLLEIARRNDRVRHEERVRYKEQMRLDEEFKAYKPTIKQIEETTKINVPQKPDTKGQ